MTTSASPRGRLAGTIQPFVDKGWVAGAVMLVANREHVLSIEAVGFADLASRRPMRPNTLFWVASQTKSLTATALMMLVDEGKLRLDDPVEAYLPEFGGQWMCVERDADHMLLRKPPHPITVRNILSHTSGLPHVLPQENPARDVLSLCEAVRGYAMTPLQFEPDTRYQYSNAGINTAGRIVEVVSGMEYEEFLKQRLLTPLGMKDTTFRPGKKQIARLAKSYKPNADGTALEETLISQLRYPLDERGRQAVPAGGLFSTANDIARFCQMILNDGVLDGTRYLSETAVQQMTTRQTASAIAESYGLGWSVGEGWVGHGGAQNTHMAISRAHGLVLVYLTQHAGFLGDGGNGYALIKETAAKYFGR
jgi:CubicO group peptidase (beta-lactamase class C family)